MHHCIVFFLGADNTKRQIISALIWPAIKRAFKITAFLPRSFRQISIQTNGMPIDGITLVTLLSGKWCPLCKIIEFKTSRGYDCYENLKRMIVINAKTKQKSPIAYEQLSNIESNIIAHMPPRNRHKCDLYAWKCVGVLFLWWAHTAHILKFKQIRPTHSYHVLVLLLNAQCIEISSRLLIGKLYRLFTTFPRVRTFWLLLLYVLNSGDIWYRKNQMQNVFPCCSTKKGKPRGALAVR